MYSYITDRADLKACRETLLNYSRNVDKYKLALDLETFSNYEQYFPRPIKVPGGWVGESALFQIGMDPDICNHQYLISVKDVGEKYIADSLKEIIEGSVLIGHNLKYDNAFLMTQFDIHPKTLRDTMIVSQVLTAGDKFPHSLAYMYKKYLPYGWFHSQTGMSFDEYEAFKKKLQVSDWTQELTEDQKRYGADDVFLIFPTYKAIMEELDKFITLTGKKTIYNPIRLECNLISEFSMMELRGVNLDESIHRKAIEYLIIKYDEAMIDIGQVFKRETTSGRGKNKTTLIEPININSPKQVVDSLNKFGIPVENSQEATLKRALYLVKEKNTPLYRAVKSLLNAKKASSLLSKFGEGLLKLIYKDGRLHPNIHQMGSFLNTVATGRSSSSDPNIMQMPMRDTLFGEVGAGELFRASFVAPEGYALVVADLSQIEPRVTAQVTKDPMLIQELSKGKSADLHALTAQMLLNLPEPPKKGEYEREYIGKTANLAMSYGIGPTKLARFMFDETIDNEHPVRWNVKEAKEYLDRYYARFEGIQKEMKTVEGRLRRELEPFDSLVAFKNRRPIFFEFTLYGRPRRWCLTSEQERMCREEPAKLHKDYVTTYERELVDEFGEPLKDDNGNPIKEWVQSKWNEYNRTMNRIAREAYNFKVQGTSADLFKMGILLIKNRLEKIVDNTLEEGILMVVHDEVIVRCKLERAEEVKKIVEDSLIEAGSQLVKVVPITVGCKIGKSWAACK